MTEYTKRGDQLIGMKISAQHRNIQPKKGPKVVNGKNQFILHDYVICRIEKSFRAKKSKK